MTHEDLRKHAMSILRRSSYSRTIGFQCSVILSELVTAAGDIPDAIGWRYGRSVMIECKASRSDFFVDAKKPQRQSGTGMGERRFFLTPKALIGKDELPDEWGLLELEGRSVHEVVPAPNRVLDLAGHQNEKRMLLSAISRIRERSFLMIERAENPFEEQGSECTCFMRKPWQ